ncbi:MAG: diguanylate cyclase [Bacilli bacterium]
MNKTNFFLFFSQSPIPCSFHEIIYDHNQQANDYLYSSVNSSFEKMLGIPTDLYLGKSYLSISGPANEFNNQWYQNFLNAVNQKSIETCHYYFAFDNKSVKGTIVLVDQNHFICLYEDITKKNKEEDYYRDLANINLDFLVISDIEGRFIKTNSYFENLVGESFDELRNRRVFEFIHEDDVEPTKEAMKGLTLGQEVNNFVNRYRLKNGQICFLEWRAKKIGKLVYASARDITKTIEITNRLEYEMTIDNLTGLYNRHYFHKITNEKMHKANYENEPVSMIIADIDHFKYVNDTWGHPIGDDVLIQFAQLLNSSIRKTDILSRLGGEEFVIILPNTTCENAHKVAEKMRMQIENFSFPIISKMTASFGVAQMEPNESLRSWYKRTDDAMYRAKEKGRNCVVSSEESVTIETLSTSLYFEWHTEWESGNKEIDDQHKQIVELGNNLIFMFQTNVPYEKVINHIDKIIKHISNHFYYEEKILYNLKYPSYDEHCALHRDIVVKLAEIKKKYQEGELKSIVLASFLIDDFIVGHMANADAKFFYLTKATA